MDTFGDILYSFRLGNVTFKNLASAGFDSFSKVSDFFAVSEEDVNCDVGIGESMLDKSDTKLARFPCICF